MLPTDLGRSKSGTPHFLLVLFDASKLGLRARSFLFFSLACGSGHLLFATALPGSLHVGSILAGLTYGGQWALMAATASELFGLAHFGTLYNVLAMGSPLSTYLLSARLAGERCPAHVPVRICWHLTTLTS